ncbi:dihydrodipicolinate synthase family protein [Candidatus Lucifugimonas marina]|uniref:Dihydrodipicolinate synthase family protein n=1 Tax=Candidatus Lucifugimonas marina TaxID=3038979 RepID=A0AAJ5ZE81_9CHLR|nr:dihydrodipicolinate synthase family protein [SAR202 cluster bacterium JH702]MDG0869881.1 dihydrodipicolinate synthase family protein [SAR202 cluster bacterium JH639]WFG34606.1 dihydrodipicolinate synthase family protein [SAR202 cluster bacterium JH545]WFG38534.1 dihydrodipicolinate synthase family protein [SAR202 cluster bacterium JH1073]
MADERKLDGIHFMLPTPFDANGDVDIDSFKRLLGAARSANCTGVVTLGVMGEAHRLTDAERAPIIDAVVAAAGDDLTVTVGASAESGRALESRVRDAQSAGATAVMIAPAKMAKPNPPATYAYYAAAQEATEIPIVVQDLPEQTGVHLDPAFIGKLHAELPDAKYLKLEDPPTPQKITRVLEATGGSMGIFGGLGGAFLFEELQRGAIGTMTGFAYPEVLVAMHRYISNGEVERARALFYKWMPIIRYENSAGISLAIRKEIMKRRGFITTANVRPPSPPIGDDTRAELDDLMHALDLDVSNL